MNHIIRVIGVIVFSLLMYAVPVLLVCSFVYDWYDIFKLFLCVAAFLQMAAIWSLIFDMSEEK